MTVFVVECRIDLCERGHVDNRRLFNIYLLNLISMLESKLKWRCEQSSASELFPRFYHLGWMQRLSREKHTSYQEGSREKTKDMIEKGKIHGDLRVARRVDVIILSWREPQVNVHLLYIYNKLQMTRPM